MGRPTGRLVACLAAPRSLAVSPAAGSARHRRRRSPRPLPPAQVMTNMVLPLGRFWVPLTTLPPPPTQGHAKQAVPWNSRHAFVQYPTSIGLMPRLFAALGFRLPLYTPPPGEQKSWKEDVDAELGRCFTSFASDWKLPECVYTRALCQRPAPGSLDWADRIGHDWVSKYAKPQLFDPMSSRLRAEALSTEGPRTAFEQAALLFRGSVHGRWTLDRTLRRREHALRASLEDGVLTRGHRWQIAAEVLSSALHCAFELVTFNRASPRLVRDTGVSPTANIAMPQVRALGELAEQTLQALVRRGEGEASLEQLRQKMLSAVHSVTLADETVFAVADGQVHTMLDDMRGALGERRSGSAIKLPAASLGLRARSADADGTWQAGRPHSNQPTAQRCPAPYLPHLTHHPRHRETTSMWSSASSEACGSAEEPRHLSGPDGSRPRSSTVAPPSCGTNG